jgi:autotransporter-associated beta strand protein
LTAPNTYSGGTVVNSGTLVLSRNGGDGVGVIRGSLTINAGAVVQATLPNSLGWASNAKIDTVNINGGLLDSTASGDQGWGVTYNLTGGTMQTNGGVSSGSVAQVFAFGGNTAVNTNGTDTTSVIGGRVNLREGNTANNVNFNVASGITPSGVDLLVSAAVTGGSIGITKLGSGTMLMTGSNSYTGTTTISEGTLQVGAGANDGVIGGPIVNNSALIYSISGSRTYSGGISGIGAFTKIGAGALTLSSNGNTYTGATTVSAGKLIVSGSLSGTTSVDVAAGSTLDIDGGMLSATSNTLIDGTLQGGGDGVTGGLVGGLFIDSNATLAPGKRTSTSTAGTLTAAGGVTFLDTSSVFSIRLGVGSASDNDKLAISGANSVFLNGAQLQLTLGANFSTQPIGFTYVILDGGSSGSVSGNFAQANTISEPWGIYNILYGVDATGMSSGNDVVLQYVAVPEPQTWAMLAAGVGLLGFNNRLRRRKG